MCRVTWSLALCVAMCACAASPARSQFTPMGFDQPDFHVRAAAAADFDGDGDMDFLLSGSQGASPPFLSRISLFRNDGAAFQEVAAGFTPVQFAAIAWGDYDNDGDPDVVILGNASETGLSPLTRLYRNDGGAFVNMGAAGLPDLSDGSAAWADFDNDGDLDLAVTGVDATLARVARVYRNGAGIFTDVAASLIGLSNGEAAWSDYDKDLDMDLAICGTNGGPFLTRIYRNDSGAFTDIGGGIPGGTHLQWADFDSDGDDDLVVNGYNGNANATNVYVNGNAFLPAATGLPAADGGGAWADADADGDCDLVLTGIGSISPRPTTYYRRDAALLVDGSAGFAPDAVATPVWADFNLDQKLDVLLAGGDFGGLRRVYLNTGANLNWPPAPPTNLQAVLCPLGDIVFSWVPGSDIQTPQPALTYNLQVGTTPGGSEVMSGSRSPLTGALRMPRAGNVGQNTSWRLHLPPGTYYWSVQTVDAGFASSVPATGYMLLAAGVDGFRTIEYGSALAVQGVQTAFGDNTNTDPGFANGSELDGAYAFAAPCHARLMLTGNLEANYNKLELFFDTKPGGQNRLRGDNPALDFNGLNRMGDDGSGNGLTFDPGFEPDYWLGFTGGDVGGGQYRLFGFWAELPTGGGGQGFALGSTTAGSSGVLSGGGAPFHLLATILNSNTQGVTAGTGVASGAHVNTGLELAIPLEAIGSPAGCFRVCAFVNGASHDFVANQVLGSLVAPQDFLGEPRSVDFGALPGIQSFEVCPGPPADVPEGASAPRAGHLWVSPNPASALAIARVELPVGGNVRLGVFDLQGRQVRMLHSGAMAAGAHRMLWTGTDDRGRALAGGSYFLRLRAPGIDETVRVLLRR